jgi:hypothetical protein
VNGDDGHEELIRRIQSGFDPMLPRPGVEQRVVETVRERLRNAHPVRIGWLPSFRTTLGSGLVAVAVVALIGGVLGLTLSLRSHSQQTTGPHKTGPPTALPAHPTATPVFTPTASPTSTLPSTIAYVQAGSVSFANASDGWGVGNACDRQARCEVGVARTTDGGAEWSLVTAPVHTIGASILSVAAGSSDDAWVWGTNGQTLPVVFAATHDGGRSWQQVNLRGATVVGVEVTNGTAWAETACAEGNAACAAQLLSQPVHGGTWTDLGPVPKVVQGPAFSNGAVSGPQLVRSGGRAWVINANEQRPALVATSDEGGTWTTLSLPCAFGASMVLGASSADHLMLACANVGGWPAPQAVWTSSDGGAHWALRSRRWYTDWHPPALNVGSLNNGGAPIGLAVINGNTAWMANDREDDLVTHDDGVTWTRAALPQDVFGGGGGAGGVTFADALHGWTFATAGLWVTSDGGVHWRYQPIIGPVTGY